MSVIYLALKAAEKGQMVGRKKMHILLTCVGDQLDGEDGVWL